jgi:smad nuclear-interacting protein 1
MPDKKWRLYVFKGGEIAETLHMHRQNFYLFGRDHRVADVVLLHESCSKQHAVLQYRLVNDKSSAGAGAAVGALEAPKRVVKPYLLDLESTQGTFLNGKRIEGARFYELREKDCIKFAHSTREYILLHEGSS